MSQEFYTPSCAISKDDIETGPMVAEELMQDPVPIDKYIVFQNETMKIPEKAK